MVAKLASKQGVEGAARSDDREEGCRGRVHSRAQQSRAAMLHPLKRRGGRAAGGREARGPLGGQRGGSRGEPGKPGGCPRVNTGSSRVGVQKENL
ncbi:hypothetical protein L7F22_058660, partial [Adiantum nelumboides]|nr:hypothetical protein [Adiantum nelumboides]